VVEVIRIAVLNTLKVEMCRERKVEQWAPAGTSGLNQKNINHGIQVKREKVRFRIRTKKLNTMIWYGRLGLINTIEN